MITTHRREFLFWSVHTNHILMNFSDFELGKLTWLEIERLGFSLFGWREPNFILVQTPGPC